MRQRQEIQEVLRGLREGVVDFAQTLAPLARTNQRFRPPTALKVISFARLRLALFQLKKRSA